VKHAQTGFEIDVPKHRKYILPFVFQQVVVHIQIASFYDPGSELVYVPYAEAIYLLQKWAH
jgi:hypothetical protein